MQNLRFNITPFPSRLSLGIWGLCNETLFVQRLESAPGKGISRELPIYSRNAQRLIYRSTQPPSLHNKALQNVMDNKAICKPAHKLAVYLIKRYVSQSNTERPNKPTKPRRSKINLVSARMLFATCCLQYQFRFCFFSWR